ncbi:MAG: GTP-binding protein, partial [Planctomycetota bacterium]
MNLLILAGFLGAGKTSLLLQIARILSEEKGLRLAIVENEVGQVGIDDEVVREEGMQVREIYSGCICCSLRLDLVTTLLEIEREIAPDLVIVEPSGMAGPKQVVGALVGYGGEIESRTTAVIMDAERLRRMADLSLPLIEDSIQAADLILLNKVDAVDEGEAAAVEEKIRGIRGDVEVRPTSFLTPEPAQAFCETLMNRIEEHRSAAIAMPEPEAAGD